MGPPMPLPWLAGVENFISSIHRERMGGGGGGGINEIVKRLVAQERKMAKLEIQQSA